MFQKIKYTQFPPKEKPILVWDGECGFCEYWVLRWEKITKGKVTFKPYQEVAHQFQDIPVSEFKKASRFITTKGSVHSGPDSAYMSYLMANSSSFWHSWYVKYDWFEKLSDALYSYIARNRALMFDLTKALLGSNPLNFKHYWVLYLIVAMTIIYLFLQFL